MFQREEEGSAVKSLYTQPVMRNVSATVSADAADKINRVWFVYGGQEITQVPQGGTFEIHADIMVAKSYLQARTPNYTDLLPGWKVSVIAYSQVGNIALHAEATTQLAGTLTDSNFIMDKIFTGYNGPVMGASNLNFTIWLMGNLDEFATVLTPSQLIAAGL